MSNSRFDDQLRNKILKDFDNSNTARKLTSSYENAQSNLQQEVYEDIRGAEPNLSDHGITHILNVQENAIRLLSEDENGKIDNLTGIEMYCLGMLILFHDVGNVYGRENHHNKISEIFDKIRGTGASARREKTLVIKAARAHRGTAQDGSRDTLKELTDNEHLEGSRVRLRELAAVLRFADELAEGPQRTSEFMQDKGLYDPESEIYHEYASSTHILIDRKAGRIALCYEIKIDASCTDEARQKHLSEFLNFVYMRILKLNQERQYARYYSELLGPFKLTEATFNFHYDGNILDINLSSLRLTDIVIPGEQTKEIVAIDDAYAVEDLVPKLISKCQEAEHAKQSV